MLDEFGSPISWGWNDCHMLTGRALDALEGGCRHAGPHVRRYSQRTAMRYQRRVWGWSLDTYLESCGLYEVPIERAAFGDLLALRLPDWRTRGGAIMTPRRMVLIAAPSGCLLAPLDEVAERYAPVTVWRVPCPSRS